MGSQEMGSGSSSPFLELPEQSLGEADSTSQDSASLGPSAPSTHSKVPDLSHQLRSDDSADRAGHTRVYLGVLACVFSLVVGLLALQASPEAKIGPYGLIQALSPWYYIAIGILLLSFVFTLRTEKYRALLLGAHLAIFVLLLHGSASIVESAPRFPSAWDTAAFTNYIANTGKLLPSDARWDWPSFFAASALVDKAAGLSTPDAFLRWWAIGLNLLYMLLIFRIAKAFLRSDTQAWIAIAIFPVANWVGQDYYSPQSIGFLLYLTFFYILIGPLGANDRPLWDPFWRFYAGPLLYSTLGRKYDSVTASEQSNQEFSPVSVDQQNSRATGFYLGILLILMAAMATGHQLTPVMATLTALMLVIAGRTRIRGMVAVFGLMTVAWICYGAIIWWSGHKSMLVGGVGSVQGNVSTSVAAKIAGSFPHEFVVDTRVLNALIVWLLAIVGALIWRPRSSDRTALVLCFFSSFAILSGGDYGGEGMLRAYLFSLPAAVCLIAAMISKLRWSYRQVALGVVLSLLVPFFLVSRWGNELFEMSRTNELTAVRVLYGMAKPGSNLVTVVPIAMSTTFDHITEFNSTSVNLTELGAEDMSEIIQAVSGNPKGSYLIMTTSQNDYGWLQYGWPRAWGTEVERLLSQSPHFKLRYSNPDAEIFQYVPAGGSR